MIPSVKPNPVVYLLESNPASLFEKKEQEILALMFLSITKIWVIQRFNPIMA